MLQQTEILALSAHEVDMVGGGNDCTQDIAGVAAGVAGVIAAVALAPFSFGASLAGAAASGFTIGVHAGSAQKTCSN